MGEDEGEGENTPSADADTPLKEGKNTPTLSLPPRRGRMKVGGGNTKSAPSHRERRMEERGVQSDG